MSFLRECKLKTEQERAYNITEQITEVIRQSGVVEGVAIIFCPHTTASITITENTDENVTSDLLLGMRESFPDRPEYTHSEGNSFAHIKSSVVGCQIQLLVTGGWPVLGPWQGVFFLEYDGPRERRYSIKVFEC